MTVEIRTHVFVNIQAFCQCSVAFLIFLLWSSFFKTFQSSALCACFCPGLIMLLILCSPRISTVIMRKTGVELLPEHPSTINAATYLNPKGAASVSSAPCCSDACQNWNTRQASLCENITPIVTHVYMQLCSHASKVTYGIWWVCVGQVEHFSVVFQPEMLRICMSIPPFSVWQIMSWLAVFLLFCPPLGHTESLNPCSYSSLGVMYFH